jgi:restriction system protein
MTKSKLPTYDMLMNPLLQAMKSLGGSGTIEEINTKVSVITGTTDEQLEVLHNPERGGVSEIEYRLGWTRTYLKRYGILENSVRGVWALTQEGSKIDRIDERAVVRFVREKMKAEKLTTAEGETVEEDIDLTWQDELLSSLLEMEPPAFERLIQRMLRESGFIQVEVTGRSGDGGIDGRGILRLGGLLSFHVIFQCKRWQGSVGPGQVRDFRGAMVGRADKGLLITTGTFTQDAIKEATRDGAPAIDLIDGDQLLEKLKQLALGVKTQKVEVEQITIDHDWFTSI